MISFGQLSGLLFVNIRQCLNPLAARVTRDGAVRGTWLDLIKHLLIALLMAATINRFLQKAIDNKEMEEGGWLGI